MNCGKKIIFDAFIFKKVLEKKVQGNIFEFFSLFTLLPHMP